MGASRNRRRKEAIFDRYATNLQHIKNTFGISFQEGFDQDAYLCPLTFKLHNRRSLDDNYSDSLTFEHAPPKSLGGTVVALTSKDFNNKSGYTSDENFRRFIQQKEFIDGNGEIKTKFKFGNFSVGGRLTNNGKIGFSFEPKGEHRAAIEIRKLLTSKSTFDIQGSFHNPKFPKTALLKNALLIAFKELGYSIFFGGIKYVNPNTKAILDQLQAPKMDLIKEVIVIREDFSDDLLGTSVIYEPRELRSLMVVFDVRSKSTHRIGVLLPGPDAYGWENLATMKSKFPSQEKIKFKSYAFRGLLDLTNLDDSLEYYRVWTRLNGMTRA